MNEESKMSEESKIASIKSNYKDVNDIDADIQYNQETREYVVIDKNNNIVKTFKSLDEELEQFEQAGQYVPYDNSSHPTRVNENSSNSNRKLNNKSNDKIDIYFSVMANIISAIRSMAASINDCDTSYANCLTGELRDFYNTLNDNTPEAIKNLLNIIMAAASVTESSVSLCYDMGIEILKELEALISGFSQYAQNANNPLQLDTSSDEPLNYDDYAYFFDNINEIFDGRYEDIINNFKFNLAIGYQKLLEVTIPKTIDNIIENTYLRNCNEEIGSEKYYEGLKTFKDSFGKNILSHYDMEKFDIEESNIPAYLWEDKDADNYQKSLLMLSYNGEFDDNYEKMIKGSINNACDEIGIYIKDLATFDNDVTQTVFGFKEITDYYNMDFDKETEGLSYKEQIKRILEITKEVRYPFESENDRVSKYTMESAMFPNLGGNVDTGKCFVDTLKELHYFDNLSKEYDDKTLYENTFNYEFLTNIAVNEGTDKVYSVIEKYYDKCFQAYGYQDSSVKAKELAKQLFQETPFASNFTTANMTNGILNNINYSYDKLSNDKVTLDASKANFKLGLLESLDTSSITNADVADARKLIGNDAKYLEEWQIKGYYKIYQEDKERAKELLNDTLYNIIQDGRGYAKAKDIYNLMTGEEQKKLLKQITHNEIYSDVWGKTNGFIFTTLQGFGDGVVGSVRNVADVAFADGKMDSHDYYLSYLQKMLSAGGFHNDILKLNYDLSSSVGNMMIPMALSAFVSPHAMTAWIALAETGSEREQALRHGEEDNAMTWANAIAKGLLAAGFEKKLGALKGYGAKEGELLKIFTKDNTVVNKLMNTSLGKKIAYALSACVNETFEELGENVGGYGIDLLTGRDIDWKNVPQETLQTIYMTMLTTPFVNMMGEGFQNSDYSAMNRMHHFEFDGFDIECSKAELLRFTDNQGHIDNQGLFQYLSNNGRINIVFGNQKFGKTSLITNSDSNVNLERLNQKLSNVSDEIRNTSFRTLFTVGMLIDSIDMNTGKVSAEKLEKLYFETTGFMNTYDPGYIVRLMKFVGNGVFDDVKFPIGYNKSTGEEVYVTFEDVKPFSNDFGRIDYDLLNQHLISEGKINGITSNEDSIIYVHEGKKSVIDKKTLLDFIGKNNMSYESVDKNKYAFSNEFYQIIESLKGNGDNMDSTTKQQLKTQQDNMNKLLKIMEYCNSGEQVRKMLKWTRDELPGLYDCLEDLVSEEAKEQLKYSTRFFDSKEEYYDYLVKNEGCTYEYVKGSAGMNCSGRIYTYIDSYTRCKMVHEGNHSLGNLGYYNNNDGLKEALTESFNHRIQEDNGTTFPSYISYTAGTNGIDTLMDAQLPGLSVSDFMNAYYVTHDLTDIKIAVDRIGGQGYFESEFLPAFNSILIDSNDSYEQQKTKIDKIVTTLISTYHLQF